MKKEYHFTITRTDRIYLIALVMLLLAWELVKFILPKPGETLLISDLLSPVNDSTLNVSPSLDRSRQQTFLSTSRNSLEKTGSGDEASATEPDIIPIAVMEAGLEDLTSIGFHPRIARNIEKYRSAGGHIRDASALLRIYGMDSAQLERVLPYIIFPEVPAGPANTQMTAEKTAAVIDLNSADSSTLDGLPGIGPVLTGRILRFRASLGGFYDVSQLKECYGLSPETWEMIRPSLALQTPHTQININAVDLKTIAHPYLPKKIAKIISSYRDQHGPFTQSSDLRKAYPPDTAWCDMLLPYIRFE